MSVAMAIEEKDLDNLEKRQNFTVSVIGCTRDSLAFASFSIEAGFKTIIADKNHGKINILKNGEVPSIEPHANTLLKNYAKNHFLTLTSDIKEASSKGDFILLSVQTPIDLKRKPDYSHIEKTCKEIGTSMRKGCLIILTNTVGVGLTERLVRENLENASGMKAGINFGLVYSPMHFPLESNPNDFAMKTQYVSAVNEQSFRSARLFLSTAIKSEITKTESIKTMEVADLLKDAFQDVKIALVNEFAQFCERVGIDLIEVQNIVNGHSDCHLPTPRISKERISKASFLLLEEAAILDVKLPMLELARKINDKILYHAFHLAVDGLRECNKTMRRAKVCILGVSSHTNVKELYGSSTRKLVGLMKRRGMIVRVYDPLFSQKELLEKGYPAERTLKEAIEQVDCIVITVGHEQFKRLNLKKIKLLAKKPAAIVDMGYVIDPDETVREGFVYRGLGRGILTK